MLCQINYYHTIYHKKQTFLISSKVKPQNNHNKKQQEKTILIIIIRYDKNKVTVQMFSGLLTYNDCAIIH